MDRPLALKMPASAHLAGPDEVRRFRLEVYMSPEQAAGTAVTTATDVYGLGAMLFHQITGHPSFEGASPIEVLRRVTAEDAAIARVLAPWVDRDLSTVCGKCLQRDPAKRYRSAAALAEDLDRWLEGEAVTARPIGAFERSWRWARRRPVAAGGGGAGRIGGVGGGGFRRASGGGIAAAAGPAERGPHAGRDRPRQCDGSAAGR